MFVFTSAKVPHILIGLFVYVTLHCLISLFHDQKVRKSKVIAFFHPYCDGGGGGERVLWIMIRVLFDTFQVFKKPSYEKPGVEIVIYSGETTKTKEHILDNVINKFGITFNADERSSIQLINIRSRTLLEAKWYPVATLILQSLAGVVVGLESVIRRRPDVYIDTIGAALAYPLIRLLFARQVVAYVHYPAISTDMLQKVWQRRPGYNNQTWITSNSLSTHLKHIYYRFFAILYSAAGQYSCDRVFANSSWTRDHLLRLGWRKLPTHKTHNNSTLKNQIGLLYPPCGPASEASLEATRSAQHERNLEDYWANDEECRFVFTSAINNIGNKTTQKNTMQKNARRESLVILSVGQFRPEKDHFLQLRVIDQLIKSLKESCNPALQEVEPFVKLAMLGSTRHKEDEALVHSLRAEITRLGLEERAFVLTNRSLPMLKKCLQSATIGLHSMWNEHFGISVVEMLAAGLLTIAHGSGGPKADIIQPYQKDSNNSEESKEKQSKSTGNGFLACEVDEYVDKAIEAITLVVNGEDQEVRDRARESGLRFSDQAFAVQWANEAQAILRDL